MRLTHLRIMSFRSYCIFTLLQKQRTMYTIPVLKRQTWNKLPDDVTSAESLSSDLKLACLPNPFSDYSLDWHSPNLSLVDLAVVCIT